MASRDEIFDWVQSLTASSSNSIDVKIPDVTTNLHVEKVPMRRQVTLPAHGVINTSRVQKLVELWREDANLAAMLLAFENDDNDLAGGDKELSDCLKALNLEAVRELVNK